MSKRDSRAQPLKEDTVSIDSEATPQSNTAQSQTKATQDRSKPLTDETLVIEDDTDQPFYVEEKVQPGKRHFSLGWSMFFLFSFTWILYLIGTSVSNALTNNFWLGTPLAIISTAFLIVTSLLIKREFDAIQRVDNNEKIRGKIQAAITKESVIEVHQLLKPRLKVIKKNYPKEYEAFEAARRDRHTPEEYLSLFENIILSRLDKDVDQAIKKATISIAALVAISPHPALDAFLVLFRANRLIKRISQIYGLRPTGLSSAYLLKHSIISAIIAASIEEVGGILVQEIGKGLTEKLSKLVAEGLVSSTRIYRLGHVTKNMIRPLPL